MNSKIPLSLLPVLACVALTACAMNPVTGERELTLVSESQEIALGRENYGPGRQMYGGDYVVDPAVTDYVQSVGQRLAAESDRALPYEFAVVNDGTPNAWALPGGKIAIHRGLLTELDSEAELAAVLGHEIVHSAARHGAQAMERGLMLQGAVMATSIATDDSEYGQLAALGANVAAGLISLKYSRDAEREADAYGTRYMAEAGYDPRAAIALQETFVELSEGNEPGWMAGLFASHPPSQERVENNRQTVAQLSATGTTGEAAYVRAMSQLTEDEPAYVALRKGRKALSEGDTSRALSLAREAVGMQPRETLFHTLEADALVAMGQRSAALSAYDRAVARNPDYFYPLLQRGLLLQDMGQRERARSDILQAEAMLPTTRGREALGDNALASGRSGEALEYYRLAAQGDDRAGQRARGKLIRLDLPRQPHRYLQAGVVLDHEGRLIVDVNNPTPVTVTDIVVAIRVPAGSGFREQRIRMDGSIGPGQHRRGHTGLGKPPADARGTISAAVVEARVVD